MTHDIHEALRSFHRQPRPVKLRGAEMAYEWGDDVFIARLLGRSSPQRIAELWLGAHPGGPSTALIDGVPVGLGHVVAASGGLPYLLKVLSAARPLSIQAHPSRPQAREGFHRENQAGKPLKDPTRNYKDDNHKPELICALTGFYALRGFRPLEELAALLRGLPELHAATAGFHASPAGLRELYTRLMRLPQHDADAALAPLVERLRREHAREPFGKADFRSWLLRADEQFSGAHKDRGLFSVVMLNLVHLRPGQAMYLPAGELHAYLEGTGMEVMASSDNVLRGGLTPKHVDVEELLRTLAFEAGRPEVLAPQATARAGEGVYATPAEEFELRCIDLPAWAQCARPGAAAAEILVATAGAGTVATAAGQQPLAAGEALYVPAGVACTLATAGGLTVYAAGLPGRA